MTDKPTALTRLPDELEPMSDEDLARRNAAPLQPVMEMQPGVATPMAMIQTAIQSGAGIETLEKLMAMQERWQANTARRAFDSAIADARAEIRPIVKTAEVDFNSQKGRTHYKHETLDGIATQIDPVLAKNGLSYRFRSKQENGQLHVTCVIAHRDGHSEETTLSGAPDNSGNKNSYQAIGSAATYLQRYTLKLALGLSAAKDDDAQGAGRDGDNKPGATSVDDMFQARCAAAEKALRAEKSLQSLGAYWQSLAKDEPRVARCPEIVRIKDECKAALTNSQNADLDGDEIPY